MTIDIATLPKTAEQIREMPAGSEMDCIVAQLIMCYTPTPQPLSYIAGVFNKSGQPIYDIVNIGQGCDVFDEVVFRPSTEIEHTWTVMEKMRCLQVAPLGSDRWHACRRQDGDWDFCDWYAIADTAPLAICRAALLSLAGEENGEVGL